MEMVEQFKGDGVKQSWCLLYERSNDVLKVDMHHDGKDVPVAVFPSKSRTNYMATSNACKIRINPAPPAGSTINVLYES